MSKTAENSLKRVEAIALNAQGKGLRNELGDSATTGLYSIRLKQKGSLNLQLKENKANAYAELIQDRNRNARIDSGESLGRSQLRQGKQSLNLKNLDRGTYFLKVHVGADRPATYQLALSTQPAYSTSQTSGGYQYLKSGSSQSRGFLSDLFGNLFGGSSSRWNGSFINRTAANVADYNSYNFSRPDLKKNLGGRGKSGKTLARLKVNYGSESPGSAIQDDNYAMQAWTQVSLKSGKFYEVRSDSNDGTRFFFRDRKTGKVVTSLNGDWRSNSSGEWTQLLSVPEQAGGSFDFYVQYYEKTGDSAIDISLKEVQPTAQVITDSTLNLRSKPSTLNNSPIAALDSGTNLKILSKVQSADDTNVPDWYQVSTPDGKKGYVAAQSNLVQLNGGSNSIANFGSGNNNGGSTSNNNGGTPNNGGIQPGNSNNNPQPSPSGGGGSSDGKINSKGLKVVKSFEGLRLDAYLDPVGVWTIGYGTTSGVRAGMRITEAQAEKYLQEDLLRFEKAVKSNVKVPLTSDQFSALVSFTYNVGEGALGSSTLLRKLNQGDYQGAASEFARWNKGDGVELPGLTRRRSAEKALFLGQDYTAYL
ncbi:MAG: glycoside hydrolase family protein [Oscillatoriophycideae cyanobacterium NC_groundwater_1537_Pr4_S-0.65um_50_18]|nr:glycoside hydrolase family protein [Oscillatoriophycideae cyanobacterium NC_groundwater_1537_Pr4_S-0.65um_50_18]